MATVSGSYRKHRLECGSWAEAQLTEMINSIQARR